MQLSVMKPACRFRAVAFASAMLSACGGASPAAPSRPADTTTTTSAIPAPVPTSWAIRGQVVAAPEGAPIAGATLTMGDAPAVSADAGGNYTIVTGDALTRPLLIAAPGYLTRETSLTGGEARGGVQFDLIGSEPAFPLAQYREMVRNMYERPANSEPSRRWTSNPSVYIWTTWKDSGAPVDPAVVQFLIGEIRRVIPLWTAGRFHADLIEAGPDPRPSAKGWINVQFDRRGNWSRLGEDPGQVQFGSASTCMSLAIVHEFGHAMGYWHTRVTPSIMGGAPGSCSQFNLTPNEAQIARVLYSREPGNLEPDRDGPPPPSPKYYLQGSSSGAVVACDTLLRR
jgi:hypothetical protein